jgi:aspartyl-tRNA(Asn)/glutamyl-tRNA(Gln) amidotransferase subunit C
MPISRADVQHVARLARLALTDEELDRFQAQLSSILEEAEKIRRLPTEGVPPTAHPLPRVNVWRDDVVGPCLDREAALSTAPAVEQDRFMVPRIIEEEP